jgi:hypothetical protein
MEINTSFLQNLNTLNYSHNTQLRNCANKMHNLVQTIRKFHIHVNYTNQNNMVNTTTRVNTTTLQTAETSYIAMTLIFLPFPPLISNWIYGIPFLNLVFFDAYGSSFFVLHCLTSGGMVILS